MIKKIKKYCFNWWNEFKGIRHKLDLTPRAITRYFIFSFVYSFLIIVFTFLVGFLPIELENKFYDKIQTETCIDSKADYGYSKYANILDRIILINIDSAAFQCEGQKTDRKLLTRFLDKLSFFSDSVSCIYLDYQIPQNIASLEDSLLVSRLNFLSSKLIIPYNLDIKKKNTFSIKNNIVNSEDIDYPRNTGINNIMEGYYFNFRLPGTDIIRYSKIKLDDDSHYSIAYKLAMCAGKPPQLSKTLLETKYILRNKGKNKAVQQYDISNLIANPEYFPHIFKPESVVVISIFDEIKCNPYSRGESTPIDKNMPNAIIQLNNYLCLISSNYLESSLIWVFLINMIVVFGHILFFNAKSKISEKQSQIIQVILKYVVSFIVFQGIGGLLFIFADYKLSLGVSFFLFPHIKSIYKKINPQKK